MFSHSNSGCLSRDFVAPRLGVNSSRNFCILHLWGRRKARRGRKRKRRRPCFVLSSPTLFLLQFFSQFAPSLPHPVPFFLLRPCPFLFIHILFGTNKPVFVSFLYPSLFSSSTSRSSRNSQLYANFACADLETITREEAMSVEHAAGDRAHYKSYKSAPTELPFSIRWCVLERSLTIL